MLAADLSAEHAQSVLAPLAALAADPSPLHAALAALTAAARHTLGLAAAPAPSRTGQDEPAPRAEAFLDLRYRGQSYELPVSLPLPFTAHSLAAAAEAFHAAHAQRYGYSMHGQPLEAVTLRLRLSLPGSPVRLPRLPQPSPEPPGASPTAYAQRPIWLGAEGPTPTPFYRRELLAAGDRLRGPSLILQYDSTMLLGRGWTAAVDAFGNLWCAKEPSHG
jgi:N-methylhydantoinase A